MHARRGKKVLPRDMTITQLLRSPEVNCMLPLVCHFNSHLVLKLLRSESDVVFSTRLCRQLVGVSHVVRVKQVHKLSCKLQMLSLVISFDMRPSKVSSFVS